MANRFANRFLGRKGGIALAAAGLIATGGAAGALAVAANSHSVTMAPATPVAIRSLGTEGIVTIRGRVAEVYGSHFILADGSGRALVDAGRDDDTPVTVGQPVTVQGRFDDGFVRAAFLVDANGKVEQVGPLGGPRDHGPKGRHGPDGDRRGPDGDRDDGPRGRGDDRGPPPPPPAGTADARTGVTPPPTAGTPAPVATAPVTAPAAR